MPTRNITLSLPDELIRRAKILAAERESSVSAIVSELLVQVVGGREAYDELWEHEEQVMASGPIEVGQVGWTRDELHQR